MTEKNKDKNIGYSQFLKLCNVDDPRDWYGMAVRPDGVWVKPPLDDVLLLPSERAALSEHPKNDLTIPALALPCSIGELRQFLDWLSNYWGSSIEPVELPKEESETQPINEPSSSDPFDAGAFFNSKQTDNSKEGASDQPDNAKEPVPSTPIERDEAKERALWEKHIKPIVEKHCLKTDAGDNFKYQFFEKKIDERNIQRMMHNMISFCTKLNPPWDQDQDGKMKWDFMGYVLRLRDSSPGETFFLDNGQPINLKNEFRSFLKDLYIHETLPEFLELLDGKTPAAKAEKEASQKDVHTHEEGKTQKNKVPILPCPKETQWKDIQIIITSHTTAKITTPTGSETFSFHELGFKDIRKGDSPIKLWETLLLFAKSDGRIDGKILKTLSQEDSERFIDRTRILNKKLKQLFGIDESIYNGHYKKHRAYITRFKIKDKRILDESEEIEKSTFDYVMESVNQKINRSGE